MAFGRHSYPERVRYSKYKSIGIEICVITEDICKLEKYWLLCLLME